MKILIVRPYSSEVVRMLAGYCIEAFDTLRIKSRCVEYIATDEADSLKKKALRWLSALSVIPLCIGHQSLIREIKKFAPDVLLVIKGHNLAVDSVREIKKSFPNLIIANYWIDDPHYLEVSSRLSVFYDFFFTNSLSCVEKHKAAGSPNPCYLTFGCSPSLHKRIRLSDEENKKYKCDICFAGTLDEKRLRILETLPEFDIKIYSEKFYNHFGPNYKIQKIAIPESSPIYHKITGYRIWDQELVKAYNGAKIILNIHSPQNAPIMRDFEATACGGGMLVTDDAEGLAREFAIGSEIVCFSDGKNLKNIIAEYLSDEEKRKKIAENGFRKAHSAHTYVHRMKELLAFISSKKKLPTNFL